MHGPTIKQAATALAMTRQAAGKRAVTESWPFDLEPVRGGHRRVYRFAFLPPDVQEAVRRLYPEYAPGLPAVPSVRAEVSKHPVRPETSKGELVPVAARSFGSLPASSRDAAFSHLYTVNQLRQAIAESPRGKTAAILALATAKQMAPNTLRNWLAIADQARAQAEEQGVDPAGAQLVALAPAYGQTRGRVRAFSPEALEWAKAVYCREERLNLSLVYRELEKEARYRGWQVGSYDALARYIERHVPPAIRCAARHGLRKAEAAYVHKLTRNYDEIWSNFMWVTDHHILDVHVLDDHGHAVRPWLTAWLDMKSRSIVGWCFSLTPSSKTVALALRHGILPKDDARFPQHGVPQVAYLDNGKDMRSEYLRGQPAERVDFPADMEKFVSLGIDPFYVDMRYDPAERAWVKKRGQETFRVRDFRVGGVFTRLGISPRYATAYHPWAKPIERAFREVVQNFSRLLPGWCGTNPQERPEKWRDEVKGGKLLPLPEVAAVWADWAVTRYNGEPKDVLGGATPTEVWLASCQGQPQAVEPELLDFALLKRARVKVHNWGFSLFGLKFELALGSSREEADLMLSLTGRYVDVHHDFALTTVRLYYQGDYVCDGRLLQRASFLDQTGEVNQRGLEIAGRQKKILQARRDELHRAPVAQRPDAYLSAVGSLALPGPDQVEAEEHQAQIIPLQAPEPPRHEATVLEPADERPNFANARERYDWCWRRRQAGRSIPDYDAAWLPTFEESEFFQTSGMAEFYRNLGELYARRRQTG